MISILDSLTLTFKGINPEFKENVILTNRYMDLENEFAYSGILY